MLRNISMMVAVAFLAMPCAFAGDSDAPDPDKPSWIYDTSAVGQDKNGTIRSDQIFELGSMPSNGLQLEGENQLRRGNLESALLTLQKAVEMAPYDMDKRILYAQALEQKLMKQKKKDPVLFNFLVKQWFFIYKKAEFPDQTLQARAHIVHMTGTAPKGFEREKKFLERVMIPEDGSAKVALDKKTAAQ